MKREMTQFTKPEELTSWADSHEERIHISGEDAGLLLQYMADYGYAIGSGPDGGLYRQEIVTKGSEVEPVTLDEVIDMACEWNYERILDADARRGSPGSGMDGKEDLLGYEKLKAEEARLEKLFEQTIYSMEIDAAAKAIADAVVSRLEEAGPKWAAAAVTEGIRGYSAGRKGR